LGVEGKEGERVRGRVIVVVVMDVRPECEI
jgi:hypothetical protein